MQPMRILVAGMSPTAAQCIERAAADQPGLEINACDSPKDIDLLLAVRSIDPDALFMGVKRSGDIPGIVSHLVAEHPQLVVATVDPRGTGHQLFFGGKQSSRIEGQSCNDLIAAIRRSLGAPPLEQQAHS